MGSDFFVRAPSRIDPHFYILQFRSFVPVILELNSWFVKKLIDVGYNSGNEMDVIIDNGGTLHPVEIKSGKTITSGFFKNFKFWQRYLVQKKEQSFMVASKFKTGAMDWKLYHGIVWKQEFQVSTDNITIKHYKYCIYTLFFKMVISNEKDDTYNLLYRSLFKGREDVFAIHLSKGSKQVTCLLNSIILASTGFMR